MNADHREITPFLLKCAQAAAQETLAHFRKPIAIDNKQSGGFDPVTLADRNAEQKIRALIEHTFPEDGIIGEEFGTKNGDSEYCWVIDPIDGTRSYISGLPLWGVLVGLYHKGRPHAGIMHQPFTGEYYVCDGQTSFMLHNGKQSAIQTRSTSSIPDAILMTTSPDLFSSQEFPRYKSVEEQAKLVRYGADCYAYSMLASGHIDIIVESGLYIYDIAALIPIVEKAGGKFTSWDGSSASQAGQVVATANPELHDQVLEQLNR